MIDRQATRFALVGVANTAVGLGAIFVCMGWLRMPEVPANVVGYVLGFGFSYVANSKWTFRRRALDNRQMLRYVVAFAIAYTLNLGALVVQTGWLALDPYIAQVLSMAIYTVAFFALCRLFVYRHTEGADFTPA